MRTLLALVFACLLPFGASAAEILRAAYEDKSEPPYYVGDSAEIDATAPGVSVELLRAAAKAAGIEIQFIRMPWVRCLKSLERGEVDAAFNSSFKLDPTRRIATLTYSLYRLKGGAATWDGSQLSGLDGPVGIQAGYSIGEDLARKGIKTEDAADATTNFKKLVSKRIPAVAVHEVNGDALLSSHNFPSVEKMLPPLAAKDYFVMFSHQFYDSKRALAETLWDKLAEARERDGAALYAKYEH